MYCMNQVISVNSPPRSGNNFLHFFLRYNANLNKLPIDVNFTPHRPKLLLSDNYNLKITVLRDPEEVLLSQIIFNAENKKENEQNFKNTFDTYQNNYLEFLQNIKLANNSYFVLFEDLKNNTEKIIKEIFLLIKINIDEIDVNPDLFISSKHPLLKNEYKSPYREYKKEQITEYEHLKKISESFDIKKIKTELSNVLINFPNKRIM